MILKVIIFNVLKYIIKWIAKIQKVRNKLVQLALKIRKRRVQLNLKDLNLKRKTNWSRRRMKIMTRRSSRFSLAQGMWTNNNQAQLNNSKLKKFQSTIVV